VIPVVRPAPVQIVLLGLSQFRNSIAYPFSFAAQLGVGPELLKRIPAGKSPVLSKVAVRECEFDGAFAKAGYA
jgi:hypothetical protein